MMGVLRIKQMIALSFAGTDAMRESETTVKRNGKRRQKREHRRWGIVGWSTLEATGKENRITEIKMRSIRTSCTIEDVTRKPLVCFL